jgi:hypothetical protein
MFRNYVIGNGNLSLALQGWEAYGRSTAAWVYERVSSGRRKNVTHSESRAGQGSISGAGQHKSEMPLRTARGTQTDEVSFLMSQRKFFCAYQSMC